MNKLLLFSIFLVLIKPVDLFSQKNTIILKSKIIVEQRNIHLNSASNAFIGGKSRVSIPVQLPKNTVEWFYSFSTSKGVDGSKNLNLALQLGGLLIDPSGITSKLASSIKVPKGSNSIDSYLLNNDNETAFIEKWDNNGSTFNFYKAGSSENTKQAVINVKKLNSELYFIGLRNTHLSNGVNIIIEVTAIVKEEIYLDEWNIKNKNKLKTNCLSNFNTNGKGKNEVCNCLINSLTENIKPSEWLNKSEINMQNETNNLKNKCYENTGNIVLKNEEEVFKNKREESLRSLKSKTEIIDKLMNESRAFTELNDIKSSKKAILKAISIIENDSELEKRLSKNWIGNLYNSLAWKSILLNELEDAGNSIRKALTYDGQNMYTRGNLGLYHLLNKNYNLAKKTFLTYKRRDKFPDGRRWSNVIASDLTELENVGLGNEHFNQVRKLLKIKR